MKQQKQNPLYVTFDTNAYSNIARPQMRRILSKSLPLNRDRLRSKIDRLQWWYLKRCIRLGRIVAGIPEPALKAEVIPNADRVSLVISVGTSTSSIPPAIDQIRIQIIDAAFRAGFRVLRSPRIGYGAAYPVPADCWAEDAHCSQEDRHKRESAFIRHFNNYPLENLRDLGERLSAAHGLSALPKNAALLGAPPMSGITPDRSLWRDGLAAEEANPTEHTDQAAFQKALRTVLSDWVDFEIVAVHYAYGYDILCSNENRRNRPHSIFATTHAAALSSTFGVKVMNVSELARFCWKQFRFPIVRWRNR